jgi:diaminopimelate epimerase
MKLRKRILFELERLRRKNLHITVSRDHAVTMAGPAETVYEGEVRL